MARPRGGQRKHWAEDARVRAWYLEIKRRSGWTDYRLDYEFAWTDEGRESRTTDHRPRMFEWMRKSARKPMGLDKRWRNMTELVVAVEQHPLFKGTQAIYEAEIWHLLQETVPTIETVQERVDRLLQANRLARIPTARLSPNVNALLNRFGNEPLFGRCLRLSLLEMDRFSKVALVWLLYLQTEPAHNWPIRAALESLADRLLDDFFATLFPREHLDYYTDAVSILLRTRMDLSSREYGAYGSLNSMGAWPIIPQTLVGKLTEEHLSLKVWSK